MIMQNLTPEEFFRLYPQFFSEESKRVFEDLLKEKEELLKKLDAIDSILAN